ncbi:hypothetical protein FRC09_014354 [Ceratobasidium sp. 395]|nr:hypothetical protein FRC09_014354 [Ceratobasidium sp. 395]
MPPQKGKSLLLPMWLVLFKVKFLVLLSVAVVAPLALGLCPDFNTKQRLILRGDGINVTREAPQVDWAEGTDIIITILTVVIVSSLNDWQKERQLRRLNNKKEDRGVKVIRDGKEQVINVKDVLIGDIALLEPGEIIPCDGVLLYVHNVRCDDSGATGESNAIKKVTYEECQEEVESLKSGEKTKLDCFIVSESKLFEDAGQYIVIAVGPQTFHGRIMAALSGDTESTPLQLRLNALAELVAKLGPAAGLIFFSALTIKFFIQLETKSKRSANEKAMSFVQIIIVSVALIVVAVPKGLRLAVALALAFAAKRMTKERLLVYVSVVAGFVGVHRKFAQRLAENSDRQNLDHFVDDQASNSERIKSYEDTFSLKMADLNTVVHGPPHATLSEAITVNSTALYQSTPDTVPKPVLRNLNNWTPEITDTITSIMQMDEVIQHLIQHRCPEITKDLDLDSCSHRPITWGGFGEIYLGKLHGGTEVAIKCSRKLQSLDRSGGSSEILKHTAREIYAWAKCDHPGILKFRGIARFRNQVAMVSEWMPNGSLSNYLRKRPSINRIQLCVRLSEALEYMHARGVVHGDIKPHYGSCTQANVLMSNDDTPLFADFGNALLECETSLRFTPTTSWGMTPRYMASELLNGSSNQHNFKSDIYAFGMVGYH